MNRLIRSLLLTVFLASFFSACSRNEGVGKDDSVDTANTGSAKSKDLKSGSEIVETKANQSVDTEFADPSTPSDESGGKNQTISRSTKSTKTEREQGSEENVTPVKGVEERRSSESALAKGDINFDDLKFNLEKDAPFDPSLITEGLKELDGRNVKLRGYILPSTLFSETNISQFVLVRDNQECCFGPGAALYDCVMIQMVEGNTTDFVTRPVTVAGRFVIDTESYRYPPGLSPNGATHMAIFRIEGLDVQ